jgi:hypothetical protein
MGDPAVEQDGVSGVGIGRDFVPAGWIAILPVVGLRPISGMINVTL